jgi:hypothetical protein
MLRIVAIALTLTGAAVAVQADIYRYVDAEGHVQYSDRWVPGSERIRTTSSRSSSSSSSASRASSSSTADDDSSSRATELVRNQQTARAVQQDLDAARAKQCEEATKRYEQAIQARRLYRTGPNGERQYMTDAELSEYRLNARAERDEVCGRS